ncbi:hypothetical protein EXM22_05600 [Oceanispirochaeta crateris]|uniref:Tetratricopeptide repeat protein n=1 Tax=Oceanispirochaeta crateris TaxID=2518645 RepID=A0A5C1QJ50_9SPIO|nr:hypothetical protein [Oceanispirochaeta crateris]QEN07487.1 hypothetical protein EXM22_05600 [Oceanispirochaeta crateris]
MDEVNKDSKRPHPENSSSNLNSFLTDLVNMQDKKLVTPMDLEALQEKYDLNPDDQEKLNMLIERHLSRATEYKRNERWDNAIVETERALLFSPLDNEIRLDLAELFLNRSVKYGYLQKDLRRAGHEVRDALTLEPEHRGAKKFQKELKQLNSMLQGKQNNKKLIPLVLLLIIIMGAALYPQIRKRFQFLSLAEESDSSLAISTEPPWVTKSISISESDPLKKDFNIQLTESMIIRETNAGVPAISVAGYIEPLNGDLAMLELMLSGFDPADSIATIEIVSPGDAPLRKGETDRFQSFIYLNTNPEDMDKLYFSIKNRQAYYEEEIPRWEKEEIYMNDPLPHGIFLDMESLLINQIEGYDRNYIFYDVRVANKSTEGLNQLDVIFQWRDDQDQLISSISQSLVNQRILPFKPQSIETYRIMFDLPKDSTSSRGDLVIFLEKAVKDSINEG